MQMDGSMREKLDAERCPVVLVEITAEVRVPAAANVVWRVAPALVLVNGVPTLVRISRRCPARLMSPPPVGSAGDQAIKVIVDVRPHHHHDCQTVWLAAVLPSVGAQTVDASRTCN